MGTSKELEKTDYVDERAQPVNSDTSLAAGREDPRVKAIKRKVDWRLSAMLALMYIVNQIDRTNLPNA